MTEHQGDIVENYRGVWDHQVGFGRRPALLVIDFMKGYTTHGSPLYAPGVVDALQASVEVLQTARRRGIPIVHSNIRYNEHHFKDGGQWILKSPALKLFTQGNPYADTCDEVRPLDTEFLVSKQYASIFFGTTVASTLTAEGIDTAILIGCSTSGCIRASAVDAVQHGFRTIVIEDCVGDRHPAPHLANLFDIHAKYGDVVTKAAALKYLESYHPVGRE